MSHEIRPPLNSVIGFSELLSTKISNKQQSGYLNAITAAGKNLLSLINGILDLSKMEAEKIITMGSQYQNTEFEAFGRELFHHTESFDIENIRFSLKQLANAIAEMDNID